MTREESYNRIDAIIAKYEIDDEYVTITSAKDYDALRMARKALEQQPSNDMVSCGVFEQAMWERDVAIDQLKELGYGLGEEPKTGHWIGRDTSGTNFYGKCSCCGQEIQIDAWYTQNMNFCPNCGAKMKGDTE